MVRSTQIARLDGKGDISKILLRNYANPVGAKGLMLAASVDDEQVCFTSPCASVAALSPSVILISYDEWTGRVRTGRGQIASKDGV